MKPTCKAEARWAFWRGEGPRNRKNNYHFSMWEKRQMNRARRRWWKRERREAIERMC